MAIGFGEAQAASEPSFSRLSCRAAARPTTWASGALNSPAAVARTPLKSPASLDSTTSRDSRSAIWLTSSAEIARPSKTPPLITRTGLALAKARRPLAASTGSPLMKASAVGPENRLSSPSLPASVAARLASVFFDTEYLVSLPSERRSSVIWETDGPRYSVNTVADELLKSSVSSATAVALSARTGLSAMSLLSQCLPLVSKAQQDEKRP